MLFFCEFGILSFGRSLEFFCYSSAPARLSALNIFFCHYADLTSCLSLSIKTYFQLQVKCVCLKKPHKSNKTSYNFTLKSNDVATIRHDPIKSPIFCSLDTFFFSVHLLWWRMISVNSFMNKTRNSFIVGFNRQFIINTNTKKDRIEKYIYFCKICIPVSYTFCHYFFLLFLW